MEFYMITKQYIGVKTQGCQVGYFFPVWFGPSRQSGCNYGGIGNSLKKKKRKGHFLFYDMYFVLDVI